MAVIDEGKPPPPDLIMAWDCLKWDALPEGGGIRDQPYELMKRMKSVDNVYRTLDKARNMEGKQIHSLTQAERRILKQLMEMGLF